MIHARSRHLKSKAVNKWVINQINILPSDWRKVAVGQKRTLEALFGLFLGVNWVPAPSNVYKPSFVTMGNGELVLMERKKFLRIIRHIGSRYCSVNHKFCFYPHLSLYIEQFSGHFRNEIRDFSLKNA